MLLYIIRHGDPTYNEKDELTEKGTLQSAALAKRLARYGMDEIYSSPRPRARKTAEPLCHLVKKDLQVLEWTNEDIYWEAFSYECAPGVAEWCFCSPEGRRELRSPEVLAMGKDWYQADYFTRIGVNPEPACKNLLKESDAFLKKLGYEHEGSRYKILDHNEKRVAVFCHYGFSLTWLGTLLDIPLPLAWTTLVISHSNVSVVRFADNKYGYTVPTLLTHSNDSHIYAEGLPTDYNNHLFF